MSDVTPDRFHDLYRENRTPWDIGRPDHNLERLVASGRIAPGKIIDIGCGTGSDAVWLAGHGFTVTGVELVGQALAGARARAEAAGRECEFVEAAFPPPAPLASAPFDLAYDRGCFHSQGSDEARSRFAAAVAQHLSGRGEWISLVASRDDPDPGDPGPPRLRLTQVVETVEPFFEIELVERSFIQSNRGHRHLAWVCIFRKRA
jgi:SAM-dependent methyltransferase